MPSLTQIVVIVKGVSPIPYHPTRSYSKKANNVLYLKRSTKHIAILLLSTSLYQECKRVTSQFLMSMNTSLKHCIFFSDPWKDEYEWECEPAMLAGVNSAADDEARCSLNNLFSHSCLQRSHPCRNPVVEAEGEFLCIKILIEGVQPIPF